MKPVLLLLFGLLGMSAQAQKIHLFFLADPTDKHSPKDCSEMENFWRYVGPYLDYPVSAKTFSDRAQLLETLKKTQIAVSKDIVVFYFSGKGEAASDRVWPVMISGDQQIPMRDVMEVLRPKKAHLTLIIADCDNKAEPVYIAKLVPRPHPPTLRESSQQLYLGHAECKKMFIKIASASAGQRAMRDKNGNSLFLASFLASLKEQMTISDPRWGLNRTSETVKSGLFQKLKLYTLGAQTPRFAIDCPASVDDDEEEALDN